MVMPHIPFPSLSDDQCSLLRQWLHAAASRESYLQLQATRTQDRLRHAIRANAFRDAIENLTDAGPVALFTDPSRSTMGAEEASHREA